jgi:hypothetical protein
MIRSFFMWRIFDKRPNLSIIWIPDTRNKKQDTGYRMQETGIKI